MFCYILTETNRKPLLGQFFIGHPCSWHILLASCPVKGCPRRGTRLLPRRRLRRQQQRLRRQQQRLQRLFLLYLIFCLFFAFFLTQTAEPVIKCRYKCIFVITISPLLCKLLTLNLFIEIFLILKFYLLVLVLF